MCSVLENKHPGSNEEQTVRIHPAVEARQNLRSLSASVRGPWSLSDTLYWNWSKAAICIDSCCHCGESVTVTIHWPHGDTIYICFNPFGGCSVQAQSLANRAQYTTTGNTVLQSVAWPCAKCTHCMFDPSHLPRHVCRGSRSKRLCSQ